MKTQIGLYVGVSTAEELRKRATSVGVAIGDLGDLLLRRGLATLKPEALRAWANTLPNTRGPLGGGLRRDERLVMGAIDALKAAEAGTWRFSAADLADRAGLKRTPALWALKSLQARGMVTGMELEECDRWGRPLKSYWCLVGDAAPVAPEG